MGRVCDVCGKELDRNAVRPFHKLCNPRRVVVERDVRPGGPNPTGGGQGADSPQSAQPMTDESGSLEAWAAKQASQKVKFLCESFPAKIWRHDQLAINVAYRLGVKFELLDELLKNPHRLAEFIRFTLRSKVAVVAMKWLNSNCATEEDREFTDLMCLYHSESELSAFRHMLSVSMDGGKPVQLNVDGYRPEAEAHISDRARGGRPVTRNVLAQSRLFFGGDMLYHLNSGDFAAKFACHPKIKKGVTLLLSARHFDSNSDSLHLDWFKYAEQSESEMTLRVPVRRTEPVLSPHGKPIVHFTAAQKRLNAQRTSEYKKKLGQWEKRGKKGARPEEPVLETGRAELRVVTEMSDEVISIPKLAEVNYVEGHGLVGSDGVLDFFSSCFPGDAVYKHTVKGTEFFTHTHIAETVVVDGIERYIQISIHVEWNCGPMVS
jgi:hypothetical protein